jgi:hypothetical protein
MLSILTFVAENEHGPGQHGVQWQFPGFTITCVARDLSFAQKIQSFVAETRANPAYRDTPLGDGKYRTMPEKSIDLSPYFSDVTLTMSKLGEWDHGYLILISTGFQFSISFELHEKELDDFISDLVELAQD